ncbi:hypothetical protein BZA70DRAFT_11994 [Myxozyma melibiosi]|uniref:ABM domain-containing protein n=1 Tax=Myxozyma melibiosi TaxID=54550 RepID=A0ABR1FC94_9ASCO
MTAPKFFVVAHVISRKGALPFWEKRLDALCGVSATESLGDSYYWGQDLNGDPDSIWGLEGYTHAAGFFLGHVSTDIFKREMKLVDDDLLLKSVQGLGSPDYDLYHYDQYGGYLKKPDDKDKDSVTSHVAVHHFWAKDPADQTKILDALNKFSESTKSVEGVQSALVLKAIVVPELATLWIRTKTQDDYKSFEPKLAALASELKPLISKTEVYQSRSFIGHLDLK